MNIGFDLDKIFIDYPPFIPGALIDYLYKDKSNGILRYRLPSKGEQLIRLLTHISFLRPPIMTNMAMIQREESKNGNKFYLISSRFSFLKQQTEKIIEKYGFDKIFDDMFFNFADQQPHLFKSEVVRQLKLDRYIDDDLPLLLFLSKQNKKVVFYWLNNKEKKKIKDNLFAITQLSDILS
ncbi:hypothetical protein HYT18_02750 [Candidatus Microgenomates bacterium]|nr:hypothetical protein [Candidatus Microgenomates bacterium]